MTFDKNKLSIDKNLVHLYIVYGLPGSGKTTFLQNKFKFKDSFSREFEFFDIDSYIKNRNNFSSIGSFFNKVFKRDYIGYGQDYNFVVDGLFITPDDVRMFVKNIFAFYDTCYFEVQVYAWNEDRESCLNNDERRLEDGTRSCPSADTIKNAVFIPLKNEDLVPYENERVNFLPIEYQTVQRATTYDKFFNRSRRPDCDEIRSQEWCIGGETRDFYGNSRPAYADEARDFDELDEFLEKMCPDISFLLYKKIKRECVTLEKRHDSDYYSSCDYNYWRCDLKKLYNILNENNIIKDQI